MQDFIFYLKLGWEHIISLDALDHQLFILALIAVYAYNDFKKILILVTAFTIGHSITLALSSLDILRVPSKWVEFLIPLTIVITALDNILMKGKQNNLMKVNYYLALIFGLIHGMGFANTARMMIAKEQSLFVPLLGFEGTRLKYIIEQIQPANEHIMPIVGLPGFKPWYVFETLKGNKASLVETRAWESIRYAPGDCPFSCYYLLNDVYTTYNEQHIKIAPIGTKPHALAAVMFALNHPQIEIIYDHPVRKSGRTDGSSKLHVYHVSSLVKPNPTRTQDFIRSLRTRRTSSA